MVFLLTLQWGRDREVADRKGRVNMENIIVTLQWGRDREVADRSSPSVPFFPVMMLQWGRDREVADSHAGDRGRRGRWRASMGPRPRGRG